jgi:hypothetical protein
MRWKQILHNLDKFLADPYLRPVENDFARWMLAKLLADPNTGDETTPVNVDAMAAEYRKAKSIKTHDEHSAELEEKKTLDALRAARG